jgi:hypothetical protein
MMPDMQSFIAGITGDALLDLIHGAPVTPVLEAFQKSAREAEEALTEKKTEVTGWKMGLEIARTLGFNYIPASFRSNPQFVNQALQEFYRYWGSFALTFAALDWKWESHVRNLVQDFVTRKFQAPTKWTEQASKFPAFEIFAQHIFTQWSQACVCRNNPSSCRLLLDAQQGLAAWWPPKHRREICPEEEEDG